MTSGSSQLICSASSYPSVFLPSTRYGSFKVETSNQPSASLRRPTSAPQSVIKPFMSVTRAPVCSHSTTLARGVGGERARRVAGRRDGQLLHTQLLRHRDGGRHPARLEALRGLLRLVLD